MADSAGFEKASPVTPPRQATDTPDLGRIGDASCVEYSLYVRFIACYGCIAGLVSARCFEEKSWIDVI